jgi:hypothetical protein
VFLGFFLWRRRGFGEIIVAVVAGALTAALRLGQLDFERPRGTILRLDAPAQPDGIIE